MMFIARALVYMVNLALDVNILFLTLVAAKVQFVGRALHSGAGRCIHSLRVRPIAKHRPDRVLLHIRVEVPVSAALLLGLAPDHVIYEPLVHSFAGQRRDKGVPADVPALQHPLFRDAQCTLEVVVGFAGRDRFAEERPIAASRLHPVGQAGRR
jgi:hypothetical protein